MVSATEPGETSLATKVACLQRELGYRQRVYPKWVEAGRLQQIEADHQIATLAAILRDYQVWGFAEPGGVARGRELAAMNAGTDAQQPALI